MKALGGILVLLGLVALIYGGISWTRKDTVVDAGPVEITTDKTESVPLPPLAGLALFAGGVALLIKK
ncbi:MAG: DUF3185 domain-containing protein [Vicinamibacterales bacterium]